MIPPLTYRRMASIGETCEALASLGTDARLLAGGTDLVVALRNDPQPRAWTLLDIGGIEGMRQIREDGRGLAVGAVVTFAALARSARVRALARPLAEAAARMGTPQIRNRASLGGNVCNASPCADSIPALVALDARLRVVSQGGERWLSVADAIDGPYSTRIGPAELLTEVVLPGLPAASRTSYVRLARRRGAAKSRMGIAVVLVTDGEGRLSDVRIGCGSVTPRPHRMRRAERILLGSRPTESAFAECASEVAREMIEQTGFRWSTEYKAPVVEVLTVRALREAWGGPGDPGPAGGEGS